VVVGVDFAGVMLRIGREKLRRAGLDDRVTLVRGDATRIPVADGSIDAVTIAFGIRNVEEIAAACAEMYRVLKPWRPPGDSRVRRADHTRCGRVVSVVSQSRAPLVGRAVSHHNAAYGYPAGVNRRVRVSGCLCENPATGPASRTFFPPA